MKICCLFIIVISLQIVKSNGTVNYCGARMCGHTGEHTFCRYSAGPALSCTGYMQAPLSMEDKARVMARLNRRRSDIAMGLNDWPPAANMLKLRWVEELSREAQLWADQCRPPKNIEEYDVCRDLYSTTVGQCVASIVGEAPGLRPETMVDIWYMQRISYDGNFSTYVPPTSSHQYYGDFAQMIWSHTYMVGCGRSRFMAPWRGRLRSVERLVCNFAPRGPVLSRALWTPGTPASMCPPRSRPDPYLPGLCTYQNDLVVIDDTANMSVEEHLLLNTILEIESNETLSSIGLLDETYLKKLAITNFSPMTTIHDSSLSEKDIIEKFELDDEFNTTNKQIIVETIIPVTRDVRIKKTVSLVGRPKPYNLEDLEDFNMSFKTIRSDIVEKTTETKDLYADLEYVNPDENYHLILNSPSPKNLKTDVNENLEYRVKTPDNFESENNTTYIETSISWRWINETTKHDDLDDYLSDPETFRQLQEALQRMENDMATPVSTAGKVRRELRTLPPNRTLTNRRKIYDFPSPELQAEIERNRTKERGPMLNMVLKYLPYLKPYEKTILGEETSNSVARIMPNVILALVLCM